VAFSFCSGRSFYGSGESSGTGAMKFFFHQVFVRADYIVPEIIHQLNQLPIYPERFAGHVQIVFVTVDFFLHDLISIISFWNYWQGGAGARSGFAAHS